MIKLQRKTIHVSRLEMGSDCSLHRIVVCSVTVSLWDPVPTRLESLLTGLFSWRFHHPKKKDMDDPGYLRRNRQSGQSYASPLTSLIPHSFVCLGSGAKVRAGASSSASSPAGHTSPLNWCAVKMSHLASTGTLPDFSVLLLKC